MNIENPELLEELYYLCEENTEELIEHWAKRSSDALEGKNLSRQENLFYNMQSMASFLKGMLFRMEAFGKIKFGSNVYPHKDMLKKLIKATEIIMNQCKDELESINMAADMVLEKQKRAN